MNGVELAAILSYITNFLRYCGPEEASKQFSEYIEKQDNEKDVEASLKKFEGLYPYLSSIAEKTNKHFTDYDVVEAYWIGNKLLEKFNDGDLKNIINKLIQRGLPKSIGFELIENLPSGFMPHHNFNVFYVGVGRTTGSVETTLQNMDNCRTSWGKVVEIYNDKLLVLTQTLKKENSKFVLEEDTKTIVYSNKMLSDIKNSDVIAIHWGFAPVILTKEQVKNLEEYTNKILEIINSL